MKRKDAGEVNDEFYYDFTLSSPALKMRRLDTESAPIIINEQDMSNPVEFGQSAESCPIAIDVPVNEERAIVLFNPNNNTPSIHTPIPFSISPDSNFLSRFKNPVIWTNRSDSDETRKLDDDDDSGMTNGCLAVVPWAPSHTRPTLEFEACDAQLPDMMDSDTMDVEDNCNTQQMLKQYNHNTIYNDNNVAASGSQEWNQWQQHCMIQQLPGNFATPVTWLG